MAIGKGRGSGVGRTDWRLGALGGSISRAGRSGRAGGYLHPGHLIGDLLHGGRSPVLLGVGGAGPRQVHGPLVVLLRQRGPGWGLGLRQRSVLGIPLCILSVTLGG